MSALLALTVIAMATTHHVPPGIDRRAAASDSLADLRRARAAQERFERSRRQWLPSQSSRMACDVVIGRFCIWYDPADPPAPPEPPRVARARDALVALLDTLAARRPGDDWIAGQRVRYLVESSRPDEAWAAATHCGGSRWWCAALRGLSQHEQARFTGAAAAYDSALAAMSVTRRCAWRDIGPLVAERFAARYRAAGCDARRELERHFWWMARPFHSADGNELETEHLARRTRSHLLRDARNPHGYWGADQAAMALRYGWPVAWSRDRLRESGGVERIHGHEPAPSWAWIPAPRALANPHDATVADWQLDEKLAVARYAPRGLRSMSALPHQVARFRRGDSLLVVAVYDVSADTALRGAELDVALALSPDAETPPRVAASRTTASRGAVQLAVRAEAQLASVEIRAVNGHAAARARRGIRPLPDTSAVALSDILLLAPLTEVPPTLGVALSSALATDTIAPDATLGMFWEVYAPAGSIARPGAVSVRLSRVRASAGRRLAEALRLEDRVIPVTVRWETQAPRSFGVADAADAVGSIAFTLDLAGRTPGLYRLEVTYTTADGVAARRTRDFRIGGRRASPRVSAAALRPAGLSSGRSSTRMVTRPAPLATCVIRP